VPAVPEVEITAIGVNVHYELCMMDYRLGSGGRGRAVLIFKFCLIFAF
jgi:hypothetical protein